MAIRHKRTRGTQSRRWGRPVRERPVVLRALVLGALIACGGMPLLGGSVEVRARPAATVLHCSCAVVPTATPWTGMAGVRNPGFSRVADEAPACALEGSVDRFLRPALEARFGRTRLRSCDSCSEAPIACTSYLVERVFGAADGNRLFEALVASGAVGTRGPEPSHSRNAIEFAVSPRGQAQPMTIHLTLDVDLQVIEVGVR